MVVGFVVGVEDQQGFYTKLLKKRLLSFALVALPATFKNPLILPRLLRAVRYPARSQQAASLALLMSIGVHPDRHGIGIGQALVQAFLSQMRARGIPAVSLVTDRDNNALANDFYR